MYKLITAFLFTLQLLSAEPDVLFKSDQTGQYNLTYEDIKNAFELQFPSPENESLFVLSSEGPFWSDDELVGGPEVRHPVKQIIGTKKTTESLSVIFSDGESKTIALNLTSSIEMSVNEPFHAYSDNISCVRDFICEQDLIGNSPEMIPAALDFAQTRQKPNYRWAFDFNSVTENSFTLKYIAL